LHEIGHALGLGESSNPNSVMYPLLGPSNNTLNATDVANIEALYPSAASGSGSLALLTQAMASFAPPPPVATTLSAAQTAAFQPVLVASTHH
jgi:hypothetical protein